MPKQKRTNREIAADGQIENMREHFGKTFVFKHGKVTMPVKSLRERLGFCYSEGAFDMREHIRQALMTVPTVPK